MIVPSPTITLLLMLAVAIPATLPWASEDAEWFEVSALLEAMLLGTVLLALT